jgi:predicted transcriptional regulator
LRLDEEIKEAVVKKAVQMDRSQHYVMAKAVEEFVKSVK